MKGVLYDIITSNTKLIILITVFTMAFIRPYVTKIPFDLPILALSSAIFTSAVLAQSIPVLKEGRVLEYVFVYSRRGFKGTLVSMALGYAIIASTLSAVPFYDRPNLAVYAAISAFGLSVTLTVVEVVLPIIVARAINLILVVGTFSLISMGNLEVWNLPPLLNAIAVASLALSMAFERKVRDRVVSQA